MINIRKNVCQFVKNLFFSESQVTPKEKLKMLDGDRKISALSFVFFSLVFATKLYDTITHGGIMSVVMMSVYGAGALYLLKQCRDITYARESLKSHFGIQEESAETTYGVKDYLSDLSQSVQKIKNCVRHHFPSAKENEIELKELEE